MDELFEISLKRNLVGRDILLRYLEHLLTSAGLIESVRPTQVKNVTSMDRELDSDIRKEARSVNQVDRDRGLVGQNWNFTIFSLILVVLLIANVEFLIISKMN